MYILVQYLFALQDFQCKTLEGRIGLLDVNWIQEVIWQDIYILPANLCTFQ